MGRHSKAISEEVQWIVVRLSTKMNTEDISMYTGLSIRSVECILACFQRSEDILIPKQLMKERKRKLGEMELEYMFNAVNNIPDIYLDELQMELKDVLGVIVDKSMIWHGLRRGGYTMKQLTRVAIERSAEKWAEFAARVGTYEAEQLVFVDESAVDCRTTYRGRAWAIHGNKATRKAFFVHGRHFSILPALSLTEGILHCDIVEGAFDSNLFYTFISRLLDRMELFPGSNSVIVMDNCRIHKHPAILDLIESRGMRYEFLPPYSPDYNPIKLTFSALKYHLRHDGEYICMAMTNMPIEGIYTVLFKAIYHISLADAFGWFRHCGYM
ncbi:hypothetical protein APHAL10511_008236 [Amanita phalloides]|nr:hypothetical protein APHAL10511_008236 [Amanita phalloides]